MRADVGIKTFVSLYKLYAGRQWKLRKAHKLNLQNVSGQFADRHFGRQKAFSMTKTEFHKLLTDSSKLAFDFAKNYVLDDLPNDFKYTVRLNFSQDDPNLGQFDIYPSDNDQTVELITATEVVDLLCRKNKVPVWMDISVEAVNKNHTVFQLLCAGRYSDDINEFYYQKSGTGPFGIKSPVFPPGYKNDGTKFSLKKKKSFFGWLTKT